MAGKEGRFASFVGKSAAEETPTSPTAQTPPLAPLEAATPTIPAAPDREERRPFSTRLKPSLKRALDGYVLELKLAGWSVSQEGVLEELVKALGEDSQLRARITQHLAHRE